MFDGPPYTTQGILHTIPMPLILILWGLIFERKQCGEYLDYLQVFNLSRDTDNAGNEIQVINHTQEQPEYRSIHRLVAEKGQAVTAKVFVIDDTSHCTMLLAEEY